MKFKRIIATVFFSFLTLMLSACGIKIKGEQMTIVGSTALQPLVESAAEEYLKDRQGLFINVQGGGSGTGLSEIQQGAVAMGMSDLYAEEKKGIKAKNLVDHRILVTGIAPVVNKKVRVKNLTLKQLCQIFSGEITNWQSITGQDLPIVIVNRANGSGTRFNFEKLVLKGAKPKPAQEQDSSGMALSIVSSTPGAISYVSFSYLKDSVLQPKVDGVAPTQANVKTNRWKIWSYEHLYTQKTLDQTTRNFLEFLYSPQVARLITAMKYIPTSEMQVQRDLNGKISPAKNEAK